MKLLRCQCIYSRILFQELRENTSNPISDEQPENSVSYFFFTFRMQSIES